MWDRIPGHTGGKHWEVSQGSEPGKGREAVWDLFSRGLPCRQMGLIPLGNSGGKNNTHTSELHPSKGEGAAAWMHQSRQPPAEAQHFQFALLATAHTAACRCTWKWGGTGDVGGAPTLPVTGSGSGITLPGLGPQVLLPVCSGTLGKSLDPSCLSCWRRNTIVRDFPGDVGMKEKSCRTPTGHLAGGGHSRYFSCFH